MRKTRISLLVLLTITLSVVPFGLFAVSIPDPLILPDYEPMEVGPEFRNADLPINFEMPVKSGLKSSAEAGEDKIWMYADFYAGYYDFDYFRLRNQTDEVEIWVQLDLSFPDGDPRAVPVVTDAQVNYMMKEFDDQIIDTDEGYYGASDFHDGSNSLLVDWGYLPSGYYDSSAGKKVILISNIRDDSYYDYEYPAYVVGFYSPSFEGYFDRNIISIDCYAYEKRLGDEGTEWTPGVYVDRPNLYESTVAHEYQHLIHDDQLPGDVTYMNEACSLFAEPLNGYALDAGQIEWFLATPDNSLTQWGDQGDINILADYGAAFLWALYLTDHYGIEFMGQYTQGGFVGTTGINKLLEPYRTDFNKVFHDWRVANLLHQKWGKYGYQLDELQQINSKAILNFDELEPLRVYDISARQFNWKSAADKFGETIAGTTAKGDTQYSTGIYNVGAYGSDYIKFNNLKGFEGFYINGQDDVATPGWTYNEDDMYWYSGADDLLNTLIATEVYVDPSDPTLTLTTYWDIEDYWDFGFVQVSEEGKWDSEWISLANANTTYIHDTSAISTVVENLPGLTVWSGDIVDITFDLTEYAGKTINLGFRYVTDWATFYEGWYLFSVNVSGTEYLNSLDYVYPEVDFMVTVVEKFFGYTYIHDMWLLDDATEIGAVFTYATKREGIYVIVSPMIDLGAADYQFKVAKAHIFRARGCFNCHCW